MIALLGLFTISSSGFIIEKYFCDACDSEHQDVIILDVKKTQSHHHDCSSCVIHMGDCKCSSHDFQEKETDFILLDNLYFGNYKVQTEPSEIKLLTSVFAGLTSGISFLQNNLPDLQSLPPPLAHKQKPYSKNILFSVFIL